MQRTILEHFGIDESACLGHGGEARVYALPRGALDPERVLRVYHADYYGDAAAVLDERAAFCAELASVPAPFAVPEVIEHGHATGAWYCIEKRVPGRSLADALHELSGDARAKALRNYLDAAAAIQRLPVRRPYFGDVLGTEPLRRDAWETFLQDKMTARLERTRADLLEDVPDLDAKLAIVRTRVSAIARSVRDPGLVHGDYFPGNVMIGDELTITGVIDFSTITKMGDPRMDLAGAVIFTEVVDACTPADGAFLEAEAVDRYGETVRDEIEAYRGFYAVYFSHCKPGDPRAYRWCVDSLNRIDPGATHGA